MPKIIHMTDKAPAPVGPYSQAVEINKTIFCSGQIAIDPKTGQLKTNDISEETHLVMENIGALLKEMGLSYGHIVKTTIFLSDMELFAPMNTIYAKYFNEAPPARSCVAAKQLPKGVNVEIEVIAHREAQ